MNLPLPVWPLVRAAYTRAIGAAKPTWMPLLVFIAASAVSVALLQFGFASGLLGLACLFAAGVAYSLSIYRVMLGGEPGSFASLAKANGLVYLLFSILGLVAFIAMSFFLSFFLWGIGLEVDAKTPPDEAQAAIMALMTSPAGWVVWAVLALVALGFVWLALRLILYGAGTVAGGETVVFRTYSATKGLGLRLVAASVLTHLLPFALIILVTHFLIQPIGADAIAAQTQSAQTGQQLLSNAPERAVYASLRGALGALILPLFLLPGHGLAVEVFRKLSPDC